MILGRSTAYVAVTLMALSLTSAAMIQQDAFAQDVGLSVTITADNGADRFLVTGTTDSERNDIVVLVESPNGNRVAVDQIQVSELVGGKFTKEVRIGPLWNEDGYYTIIISQDGLSQLTAEVPVRVVDGRAAITSVTDTNILDQTIVTETSMPLSGINISASTEIGSDTIEIIGTTDRISEDVTVKVTGPTGDIVAADQASPNAAGKFSFIITTGPLWSQDGEYTVTAQQSMREGYTQSVIVDIEGGVVVPEFGMIAVMVLAIAVVAVIAVSARSKLGIMPRY